MPDGKRVFILGAGFSEPAGMPLATEVLPLLLEKLKGDDEMGHWLNSVLETLAWFEGHNHDLGEFKINIEQLFHYAYFEAEVFRLKQHLAPVGRRDGPGTPWNAAESITAWLSNLEDALRDVIFEQDDKSDLAPITRWANTVGLTDTILTFNYDTLVERALTSVDKNWNYATGRETDTGIAVCKLHGSIDWVVAHRDDPFDCDLLFDKENLNRAQQLTGDTEDDYRLCRWRARDQLRNWISGRELQMTPQNALPRTVEIAGLGAYKELHTIPGLGPVWANAMRALDCADTAIVIGFALSEFDAMAQMQLANFAMKRQHSGRPLHIIVIDPHISNAGKDRFRRVFRSVNFVSAHHETVTWNQY